jgi:prepilin-type N-terminal cleavage/methylation domain-containing protein
MKRFVLGFKRGFTLIEVMIAVMIVSVVIAAIFKLRGDTNHLFFKIKEHQQESSMATLLLWNTKYGLQNDDPTLYQLVEEFDIDDDLRRELKKIKSDIHYKRVDTIESDNLNIEIGRTEFSSKHFDFNFNRVQLR